MIRLLAERLSRNLVLRRRLPSDLGGRPIYVTPDSALGFWRRNIEKVDPELFGMARRLVPAQSVVWDIGANVGLFSFACASKARLVIAVEPDPWLASLLVRSAAGSENVHVLSAAIAGSFGTAELNIAQRGRSANFIGGFGSVQSGGSRLKQMVISVTLDWLAERFLAPDVLKIDVEGMERQVLAGGESLLRRVKPTIICEVMRENSAWVAEFLKSAGYRLHDKDMQSATNAYATTVAVPEERHPDVALRLKGGGWPTSATEV